MSFFKHLFHSKSPKTGIVFIVEDNTAYAKTLQIFVKSKFPALTSVDIFPVGETCLSDLNRNPDLVIIDYFLDTKYDDALNGLAIIEEIRKTKPELNIIVLSAQDDIQVVLDSIKKYHCSYVKKDNQAFERIEEIMESVVA
jgi:two-component system OmpR family response regulator